jgi:hypothetical protein
VSISLLLDKSARPPRRVKLHLDVNIDRASVIQRDISGLPYDQANLILLLALQLKLGHWSSSRLFLAEYLDPHLKHSLCLLFEWMSELSELYWHQLICYLILYVLYVLIDLIDDPSLLADDFLIRFLPPLFLHNPPVSLLLVDGQRIQRLLLITAQEPIFNVDNCGANQAISVGDLSLVKELDFEPPVLREVGIELIRSVVLGVQVLRDMLFPIRDVLYFMLHGVILSIAYDDDWVGVH